MLIPSLRAYWKDSTYIFKPFLIEFAYQHFLLTVPLNRIVDLILSIYDAYEFITLIIVFLYLWYLERV